jgi:hypothetical protein
MVRNRSLFLICSAEFRTRKALKIAISQVAVKVPKLRVEGPISFTRSIFSDSEIRILRLFLDKLEEPFHVVYRATCTQAFPRVSLPTKYQQITGAEDRGHVDWQPSEAASSASGGAAHG